MSQHFSASQYNDAFTPIRLQNYSPFTNTPRPYGVHSMCLPDRCCPTRIIAHDNGHLFDCIPRGLSSPWGDYQTWIWEQAYPCLCVDHLRHPEKYAPPRHIFIAREENCHEKSAKEIADLLNKDPETYKCMVERNMKGFGGGEPCCCPQPKGCCGFPIKMVVCYGDKDKKRVVAEIKRQQREWRRQLAGTRGRGKGRVPCSPAELRCVTWDGCARSGDKLLGKTYGCQK